MIFDDLQNDPLIQKTKKQLLEQARRHIEKIKGVNPPDSAREKTYQETLARFATLRSMPLWYPYIGSGLGNGAFVELEDGSVKYDFITGIGVHFGHNHPQVMEAALEASLENMVMQGNLLQNKDSVALYDLLAKTSKLDHVILTTSGAMAIENGLKLIFQKKFPAARILCFERCFMGRTLTLAQASDKPGFREGLPPTLAVDYIPFFDEKDPKGSTAKAIDALKKALWRYPKQHACMCFEMIQGESGYWVGNNSFFKSLVEVLKENNIAVLIDEVQTFGRTENLFAYQTFGLDGLVDVVTVGKLLQAGATLFKKEFTPKPGLISQTYTASTSSIKVAGAIIESLLHDNFLGKNGKINQLHTHFVKGLEALSKKYPEKISGPFGYGLMVAFTPYQGERDKVIAFTHALYKNGVISFIAGDNPTRVRFLVPAGGVTLQNIDEVCGIIEKTLRESNS